MQILRPGIAMTILVTLFLFACNKNNETPSPGAGNENLTTVAKAVTGELIQGNVKTTSGTEGLMLHINDVDILVEKALGNQLSVLPDMSSAAVITSAHGLILKDLALGNVYFLVNNDEESIRQFNAVVSLFPSVVRIDKIFGTTIVRSANG